jgi:hypothetical protein
MITLFNVLTRERWELPDAIASAPLYLANPPWPPGSYDIRNGSTSALTVVYDSFLRAVIPAGARWNVSTNENLYSWFPVGVDYAAWTTFAVGRGLWGAGWAPVARVGNI